MNYDVIADKIEVRSSLKGDKPRYIVKATAMIANNKEIYEFQKLPDGSMRTLKSMFTPRCIKSIKEQSRHKKLFVDSQHELAMNANIKSIIRDKLSPEEQKKIDIMLKSKVLPLAKLNDIDIEENVLSVDTELNPMFREVDESYQRYFDAIWYSLENKYLNGVSVNFANPKVISVDGVQVIDDIDVLGFSYVDAPANHNCTITEVAVRAMQEGVAEGEKKMEEEDKKKFEEEKKKFDEDKKKFEEEKATADKKKAEEDEATKKKEKDDEVAKQTAEQKKVEDELAEKTAALKKIEDEKNKAEAELNSAKGTVSETKPPAAGSPDGNEPKDEKFYKGQLSEITADHDKTVEILQSGKKPLQDNTFEGFGKLVNLGLQAGNPTADLDTKNAEYIEEHRLLDKGGADVIAPKAPQK